MDKLYGVKTVVPLDIYLGVDRIPFKISVKLMLDIAYWAVKLDSYQETEDFFRRTYNLIISDDTIREVVNYIGSVVYDNDCKEAEEALTMYNSCSLPFSHDKEGTLYIQTDGAALNTRTKDDNDSTWRENKLGLAFSSDNIHYWTSKRGIREHRILSREYISYVGSAQEYKKHLLALAIRCGYGEYKNTVIISDGAAWIRSIKEELFPCTADIGFVSSERECI